MIIMINLVLFQNKQVKCFIETVLKNCISYTKFQATICPNGIGCETEGMGGEEMGKRKEFRKSTLYLTLSLYPHVCTRPHSK